MKENKNSLTEKYFDDVYNASSDPWSFETSTYEKEKYDATIKALPKAMYSNVFEPGCSIGVLTAMLAARCKKLLAADSAEAPLVKARTRLQNSHHVKITKMQVPAEFGNEQYDLIVISEIAYYLNDDDLALLKYKIIKHLEKGGHLVMIHYTPLVHDYPQTGDGVHDFFLSAGNSVLKHLHHQRHQTYRLDVFEKV
jgi:2-polyprenyl-3-methyl-5-hydroxy-6-metoxy-1,4-benzoquinol methylase